MVEELSKAFCIPIQGHRGTHAKRDASTIKIYFDSKTSEIPDTKVRLLLPWKGC